VFDSERKAVSIHAWCTNRKDNGADFSSTNEYAYGNSISREFNLLCSRYVPAGGIYRKAVNSRFEQQLYIAGMGDYAAALKHDLAGAQAGDRISGDMALKALTNADDLPSLLAVYFPGPDNLGHAVGRKSGEANDPTRSLQITKGHLMSEAGTDGQLRRIHRQVKKLGALNAVIWLAVSDHGVMGTNRDVRPHPRPIQSPGVGWSISTTNPLTGGLFSLRDGVQYQTADIDDPSDESSSVRITAATQYRSEMEVFFRRVFDRDANIADQDAPTNSVWYDRPITDTDGTVIPAVDALWRPGFTVNAIYSPDGVMAHIYVREAGTNWTQASSAVGTRTRELAWYLAKESLGEFSHFPGGKPLMPKDVNDPTKGSQFQNALAFNGGQAAGVFVLVGSGYTRVIPGNSTEELTFEAITDQTSGGTAWVSLKTRLDEMVSTRAVSRSGDIVLVFNIKGSYATVNDATEEELNGWHGSPTQAESITPLVYATPGYGWYAGDNSSLPEHARSTSSSEGKYRNSDVRGSLRALITTLSGR